MFQHLAKFIYSLIVIVFRGVLEAQFLHDLHAFSMIFWHITGFQCGPLSSLTKGREHIDVGVVFVCGIGANEAAHRKGLANN